jgi:S1-C subfamily serine protease
MLLSLFHCGHLRRGTMKRFAYPFSFPTISAFLWAFLASWLAVLPSGSASPRETLQPRSFSAGNGMQQPLSAVANVKDAIGRVYRIIVDVDGAVKGGTAFLVSGQRIVATNHHVIEKGTAFTLGFVGENHRVRRMPLRVLAIYPQKDLALLETLDDLPGEALPLYTGQPEAATDLFAIGFPAAADPQGTISWTSGNDDTYFVPSVIKGYVSRVLPNRWFSSQLQHQTPIIPGYSGGPLIDNEGTVMGMSTSVHKEANGISYAVLAADIAEFVSACGLTSRGNGEALARPMTDRPLTATAPASVKTFALQPRAVVPNASDRAMLERANTMLENGDIVAARLVLEYLVTQRHMREAMGGLAKSYDPSFLQQQKVLGVSGDSGKAAQLYKQAAELGDGEAKRMLTAITTGGCLGSMCQLVNGDKGPRVVCDRNKL